MLVVVLLFLVGLAFLVKGGDLFVEQAVYFAKKLGISEMIIGATIVSIGTTLPEVTISALASANGVPDIAYGNAVGSVVCNTGLVAGVLLLLRPAPTNRGEIAPGSLFYFAGVLAFSIIAVRFGMLARWAGMSLLALFITYLLFTSYRAWRAAPVKAAGDDTPTKGEAFWHAVLLLFGAALIFAGARLLITNGMKIAQALHVPERIIALTFIALGTSLPELTTAVVAIVRGHGAISLGNIIGANFLNITLVLGLSAVIFPIPAPGAALINDIRSLIVPMLVLTLPALIWGRTMRLQGGLLLAIYAWYCAALFRS